MENLTSALATGEYALYVGSSFLVAFIVIASMLIFSLRALKNAKKTLSYLQKQVKED